VMVNVYVPSDRSHNGEGYWKDLPVDACIAPIIIALNGAGVLTAGSCCGHGEKPGSIALQDGRELEVWPQGQHESYHERIRVHTRVNEQFQGHIHDQLREERSRARASHVT